MPARLDIVATLQDRATSGLQSLNGVIGDIGVAAGVAGVAMVAAFAAAAVGVTAAAFEIGKSFDESFDSIRLATGQTGDALAGLQDDFKAVFAGVPDDAATVSAALSDLAVRTGLTGDALESLTKSVLDYSRVTGTSAKQNTQDLTRLFSQWQIATADQVTTMDKLLRASQATGIGVAQLQSALVTSAAALKGLGVDFDTATALIANFERAGVNSQQALTGMTKAFVNISKAGGDAKAGLRDAIRSIQAAGDESEAAAKSIELFGAKTGVELAAAIREGRFDVDALVDSIANGSETIAGAIGDTEDFAEAWAKFSHKALNAIEPFATAVFNLAGVMFDKLGPALDAATAALEPFAVALAQLLGLLSEGDPEQRIVMFNRLAEIVGSDLAEKIALITSGIIGLVGAMTGNDDGIDRFHNALLGLFSPEMVDQLMQLVAAFQTMIAIIQQSIAVTQAALGPLAEMVDWWTVLKVVVIVTAGSIVTAAAAITLAVTGISATIAAVATAWRLAWDAMANQVKGVQTAIAVLSDFLGGLTFPNPFLPLIKSAETLIGLMDRIQGVNGGGGGGSSGARAEGGPVLAGGSYLVGERGPEVFVPQSSGTIVPNGGGHTFNITVNAGGNGRSIADAVVEAITQGLANPVTITG